MAARVFSVLAAFALFATGLFGCKKDDNVPKDVPPSWEVARLMPGHVAHIGKPAKIDGVDRKIQCDDCHDIEHVGFKSPGTTPCQKCHTSEVGRMHAGSKDHPTTCLTCHAFTRAPDGPSAAPTCSQCHSQPQGQLAGLTHHNSKDAGCAACHATHQEQRALLPDCTKCHAGIAAQHGIWSVVAQNPSVAGDAEVPLLSDAGDLRDAASPAAPFVDPGNAASPFSPEAIAKAIAAGPGGICTTCHAPHTPAKEAGKTCAVCHVSTDKPDASKTAPVLAGLAAQAPKVSPQGPNVASHPACITCHSPHSMRKEDVKPCAGCHEDHTGVTANKGHAQCTGCHKPHAPAVSAPTSCPTCHSNHSALASGKVDKHAVCTSCHAPHTPTKSPSTACAGCHSGVQPKHPLASVVPGAKGTACTGCHAPHPGNANSIVRPCTTCHSKIAKNDAGAHAPGKASCNRCHASHSFKLEEPKAAFCEKCHATQKMKVAVMASPGGGGSGHGSCTGCHGTNAHAPVKNVACGSCHAKEATTAAGGHAACTKCHEPHSGLLGTGAKPSAAAITPAYCTGCHAAKKEALHSKIAGGCANCHRPHGPDGPPSPPKCLSCHDKTKLPGLHQMPTHAANCTSCHTAHAGPTPTREVCSKCHTDRANHQPDTNVCKGCHVFRK